jgi:hypothetical protein
MPDVRIFRHGDPCCLYQSQYIAPHRTLWRVEENPLTFRTLHPPWPKGYDLGTVADLIPTGMAPLAKASPPYPTHSLLRRWTPIAVYPCQRQSPGRRQGEIRAALRTKWCGRLISAPRAERQEKRRPTSNAFTFASARGRSKLATSSRLSATTTTQTLHSREHPTPTSHPPPPNSYPIVN